jgi:hypothetical protein
MTGTTKLIQGVDDIEDVDTLEGQYEDVSELQQDIDAELNTMFAEFGGDPKEANFQIRVYRVQENTGRLAYMFSCLPSELPILDKLRDDFDGGNFEVRILKNGKIFRRRPISVEPPRKETVTQNQNSDTAAILQVMADGFNRLGELMADRQAVQQPALNPVELQTQMMNQMILMKQFLTGEPAEKERPLDQLKTVIELQKVIEDTKGESSSNDVMISLINQVLPQLAEMGKKEQEINAEMAARGMVPAQPGAGQPMPVNRGVKARYRQPPTTPRHLRPNPQAQNAPQINPVKTEVENPMKMHLIFLCTMAAKNVDPEPYAAMVLDNTPDEKLDELIDFISGENAIAEMAAVHKPVEKYQEWFSQLGKHILEMVEPIEQETDESQGVELTNDVESPNTTIDKPGQEKGEEIAIQPTDEVQPSKNT